MRVLHRILDPSVLGGWPFSSWCKTWESHQSHGWSTEALREKFSPGLCLPFLELLE